MTCPLTESIFPEQDVMQNVSNFVGNVRAEVEMLEPARERSPQPCTSRQPMLSSTVEVTGINEAREMAEQNLLVAEKHQASVEQPAGEQIIKVGQGVSDDDFFHLMCHVDPNLIRKIEAGEFVDLDKLLPREKLSGNGGRQSDENRLEWVHRDGDMFLVPANKESKINGFRR